MLAASMTHLREGLHYRVVGIRSDGTRDPRYRNLSWETAERVRYAMIQARVYDLVVIEDQHERRKPNRQEARRRA
jgi:hypothetical protein